MNKFDWVYGGVNPEDSKIIRFADEIRKSPVIAALSRLRGVTTGEEFEKFNSKSPCELYSPYLMKDMDKAVERIRLALENGEHITVYGDYDVDGITSVSVLVTYLRSKGAEVDYYIPDRIDEGYGINKGALCSLFEGGTTLLITVDTGITACDEIEAIMSVGMDVIVTDHHRCKDKVPECCGVINPNRPDCPYPFKSLAGVGVVFKLLCALENENTDYVLTEFGDLVALGTIADVVELKDENRIIVARGLELLQKTRNIGLKSLIDLSGMGEKTITVSGIGFGLAPKINAAGRIGDAGMGVSLLLAKDTEEAEAISRSLIEENQHRQELEKKIYEEALAKIEEDPGYLKKAVLVVWGEGWHHGVIGIVSSKISEKYAKPCILITVEEGLAKGSGRSIEGFNLFDALSSCGDLFIKYGGHALAAGLTLVEEKLPLLDKAMNEYAKGFIPPEGKKPVLAIDFEIPPRFINVILAKELKILEPCGTENPQPCFSVCGCKVVNARQLSEGKHLRISLEKDGKRIDAIGFGMGADYENIIPGDYLDIAGNISINEWNGNIREQFVLQDIRYTPGDKKVEPVPDRDDFAVIYSYVKKTAGNGFFRAGKEFLVRKLNMVSRKPFNEEKLLLCLEIFAEMSLLHFAERDGGYDIYLVKTDKKVDIMASRTLKNFKQKQVK